MRVMVAELRERVAALDRLMEAKFVTMETLMRYQAEKVALALDASKEAINKADVADEKARDRLADDIKGRFVYVNELRGALSDNQANNLTRAEFEVFRTALAEQMVGMKESIDKSGARRGGITEAWGVIIGVIGIGVAIAALVFRNMG